MNQQEEKRGRVVEVRKNSYIIDCEDIIDCGEEKIPAKLRGSFYEEQADKLPVVGDYVFLV